MRFRTFPLTTRERKYNSQVLKNLKSVALLLLHLQTRYFTDPHTNTYVANKSGDLDRHSTQPA
jgi:hypothetical protein